MTPLPEPRLAVANLDVRLGKYDNTIDGSRYDVSVKLTPFPEGACNRNALYIHEPGRSNQRATRSL